MGMSKNFFFIDSQPIDVANEPAALFRECDGRDVWCQKVDWRNHKTTCQGKGATPEGEPIGAHIRVAADGYVESLTFSTASEAVAMGAGDEAASSSAGPAIRSSSAGASYAASFIQFCHEQDLVEG